MMLPHCFYFFLRVGSVNEVIQDDFGGPDDFARLGPAFAIAVVASAFGTLLRDATTDQNGPFRKCMSDAGGSIKGTSASHDGVSGVGTV